MIKRISVLALSVVCMGVFVFAGCSGKIVENNGSTATTGSVASSTTKKEVSATTKAEEKVKLVYWHNYGADKETPFFADTIMPMFKEKYPNIEVEVVAQGNDQYQEQIVISAGTKTTPDLARLDINHVAALAKIGALLPMDDLTGFSALKDKVFEGPLSANLYKGKYYGLPLDTNCKTAVFNMNTLKSLGFDQAPATMEEFIAKSREKSSGKYTVSVSSAGEWDFMPYFWLFGGVMTDAGFTKASGYLDSPQSIEAMNELVKLHEDKVLTVKEADGTTDAWDGIKSGEYAMFFEGPWFFAFTGDWKDLGLKPAVIPTYKGKTTSVIGGESIGIFTTADERKQAAFTFVEFLLSEEIQVLMGKEMGQMPVLKTAAENPEFNANEVWKIYLEQLKTAQTRVPSSEKSSLEEYIKDAFDAIIRKEMTAEAALKEAATLMDAVLAK